MFLYSLTINQDIDKGYTPKSQTNNKLKSQMHHHSKLVQCKQNYCNKTLFCSFKLASKFYFMSNFLSFYLHKMNDEYIEVLLTLALVSRQYKYTSLHFITFHIKLEIGMQTVNVNTIQHKHFLHELNLQKCM